jgi:hypothetical protein
MSNVAPSEGDPHPRYQRSPTSTEANGRSDHHANEVEVNSEGGIEHYLVNMRITFVLD